MIDNQPTNDSIAPQFKRLKNLLNLLRDDGVAYDDLLLELMQLVLIKMADQDNTIGEKLSLNANVVWTALIKAQDSQRLYTYREIIHSLANSKTAIINTIYADGATQIQTPRRLKQLIETLELIDWSLMKRYGFGNIYQDLLSAEAIENEVPFSLIDCLVKMLNPLAGEHIYDPYVYNGQRLIAVSKHINQTQKVNSQQTIYSGTAVSLRSQRLALINCLLNNIADNVSPDYLPIKMSLQTETSTTIHLKQPDILISVLKPAITRGKKGLYLLPDNVQELSLEPIYENLATNGRAAIIVPNDIIEKINDEERYQFTRHCHIKTIFRLPQDALHLNQNFSVLFLQHKKAANLSRYTWEYSLRNDINNSNLEPYKFAEFIEFYGNGPNDEHSDECYSRYTKWQKLPPQTLATLFKQNPVIDEKVFDTTSVTKLVRRAAKHNQTGDELHAAIRAFESAKIELEHQALKQLDQQGIDFQSDALIKTAK